LGQGTTKFLVGAGVGAVGGFAVGTFAATPTARSAGQSALAGLDVSIRFLGSTAVHVIDALGSVLESGYTRVRGRERYLEHEIEELREQITRLEQRMT
jgi:cytoskeletal protein RodZ